MYFLLVQFWENKHQKLQHPKILALSWCIISFYVSLKFCEFFCWISEKSLNPKMLDSELHSAPIAPPEVLQPVSTWLCYVRNCDLTSLFTSKSETRFICFFWSMGNFSNGPWKSFQKHGWMPLWPVSKESWLVPDLVRAIIVQVIFSWQKIPLLDNPNISLATIGINGLLLGLLVGCTCTVISFLRPTSG